MTLEPDAIGWIPSGGFLLPVLEDPGDIRLARLFTNHKNLLHGGVVVVRPARELHALAVEEKFEDPSSVLENIGERTRVLEPQSFQIGYQDFTLCFRCESLRDLGVRNWCEIRGLKNLASGKARLLILIGTVHDRGL